MQPDGVYRVGLPRTDLHVKLNGVNLKPSFALGSYLVFLSTGGSNAMMMGDLVLTEREVEASDVEARAGRYRDHRAPQPPHRREAAV